MDSVFNAPGHGNNVVIGVYASLKRYLKEQMELLGELANNDMSNYGILCSASKYISIKFIEQFLHIITNNRRLNGLNRSTKMQKRSSILKYQ